MTMNPLWQRIHECQLCYLPVLLKVAASQNKWAKGPFLFTICHGHISMQNIITNQLLEKLNSKIDKLEAQVITTIFNRYQIAVLN